MQYTSSEAAKLLRKIIEEREAISYNEKQSIVFSAAISENLEDARPPYDYEETQKKLAELDEKIRKVKHAINKFNLEHEVPGFGMTIDQLLVYLPQMSNRKQKLSRMSQRLAKVREDVRVANTIEYTYANYDVEAAKRDYEAVSDELSRAQTALDVLNTTVKFEIDV